MSPGEPPGRLSLCEKWNTLWATRDAMADESVAELRRQVLNLQRELAATQSARGVEAAAAAAKLIEKEERVEELEELLRGLRSENGSGSGTVPAQSRSGSREQEPESDEGREAAEAAMRGAAMDGDTPGVQRCLVRGADVNATDQQRRSAVWWAARKNQVSTIEALAQAGAELGLADACEQTPMIVAAGEGNTAAVECLLRHGADWRRTFNGRYTALDAAQTEDRTETAAVLKTWAAEHGVARELVDPYEQTKPALEESMRAAAREGAVAEIRRCLKAGADVNAGMPTALWHAAWAGQLEAVEVLVTAGASLDKTDGNGFTPLIAAGYMGSTGAAEFLLRHGAAWDAAATGGWAESGAECGGKTGARFL